MSLVTEEPLPQHCWFGLSGVRRVLYEENVVWLPHYIDIEGLAFDIAVNLTMLGIGSPAASIRTQNHNKPLSSDALDRSATHTG